jgi:DNA-directed RNA polymerase III subunit RPC2
LFLKHNTFENEIAIIIILKGMGMESDQEITQLIGTDALYLSSISCSLQEASLNNIYTKHRLFNI